MENRISKRQQRIQTAKSRPAEQTAKLRTAERTPPVSAVTGYSAKKIKAAKPPSS